MHTLYVSDLDGTLLNTESRVSKDSVALINKAIADGAYFSVATARTPATVSKLLCDIHTNVPLIVMTGAAIWDMNSNEYLHVAFHKEETAQQLLDIYRRHSLSTFVYTLGKDNIIHIYHFGAMSDLEWRFVAERNDSPYKQFHIPPNGCSDIPEKLDRVLLFYSMRPTEEVFPVYEEIKDIPNIRPVYYHDIFGKETALMEVFGEGASKAEAVRILANMIDANHIVAYGDNVNDIPILSIADDAVAVENAVEDVKRTACRIIEANNTDSVARDIARLTNADRLTNE